MQGDADLSSSRTNNKVTGKGYYTYRLVRGERVGGRVRQITLLNLGPFRGNE